MDGASKCVISPSASAAHPDETPDRPELHEAAGFGMPMNEVEELIRAAADVDALWWGRTPLFEAVMYREHAIALRLAAADTVENNRHILQFAHAFNLARCSGAIRSTRAYAGVARDGQGSANAATVGIADAVFFGKVAAV